MGSRAHDWLRQAERDLQHARDTMERETFEWAAFAAQQAAEKAVKAVYQRLGAEARGHSVTQLLSSLPPTARPAEALIEIAKDLDRHYITPRYPSQGAWVLSGKRVPVEPSVSASTGRDSDDR